MLGAEAAVFDFFDPLRTSIVLFMNPLNGKKACFRVPFWPRAPTASLIPYIEDVENDATETLEMDLTFTWVAFVRNMTEF